MTWRPTPPFCWQPREAFDRIEKNLETSEAGSAALVYVSLSRIASIEGGPTFARPIGYISKLSFLSESTTQRRILDLERIGLVAIKRRQIEGTKAKSVSEYTLATLPRKVASQLPHVESPLPQVESQTTPLRDGVTKELNNSTSKRHPRSKQSPIPLECLQ